MTSTVLFVLGMHRSGTSALCAALQAAGADFGSSLLPAMDGVNNEGFWEDQRAVDINEALLAAVDATWYQPPSPGSSIDWADTAFDGLRERAIAVLQAAPFANSGVSALKDPRLCITLPFWLSVCREISLGVHTVAISRSPLEVAQSLQRRDGFPLGFGLRLCASYGRWLHTVLPASSPWLSYDELLQDPAGALLTLPEEFGLDAAASGVSAAVKPDLRHQKRDVLQRSVLADARALPGDIEEALEDEYPLGELPAQFAEQLVTWSNAAMSVGDSHSEALATLRERDEQIRAIDQRLQQLGSEHAVTLQTVDERDAQIREFDQRLTALGEQHGHAISVVQERDQQLVTANQSVLTVTQERDAIQTELAHINHRLERIFTTPVVGPMMRKLWHREPG